MKKGFSLIELLITVAIIVVLASIIIFYFFSTQDKAKDSLIKQTMGDPLTKLAIEYYIDNPSGGYAAFCNETATKDILDKIESPDPKHPYCSDNNTNWAACAQLYYAGSASGTAKAWCIDSTGIRKEIDDAQCKNGIKFCP